MDHFLHMPVGASVHIAKQPVMNLCEGSSPQDERRPHLLSYPTHLFVGHEYVHVTMNVSKGALDEHY